MYMANLELEDKTIQPANYELGVVIARMQVHQLHEAHIALIEKAVGYHNKVIVFLGVPRIGNTPKNPLDFNTRAEMIREIFPTVTVLPLNDMRYDQDWVNQLDTTIKENGYDKALLYGSRDSFIPHYEPYGKHATAVLTTDTYVSGTEVRKRASKETRSTEDFRAGVIYANYARRNVMYPTVDVCAYNENGQILLAKKPNETLWRFVGGFVDPSDLSLEAAAEREFAEETLGSISDLRYVTSMKVNDWRYRSIDDGIMTTLYLGKIGETRIEPSDDISELKWVSLEELNDNTKISNNIVPEHIDLMKRLYVYMISNEIR